MLTLKFYVWLTDVCGTFIGIDEGYISAKGTSNKL